MAKLTVEKRDQRISQAQQKQEKLIQKREMQEQKALFGEHWRSIVQANLVKDMEQQIGGKITPILYDWGDIYDYFDPIWMYKTDEGKILNMDYEQYLLSEQKYKKAIKDVDVVLHQLNSVDENLKDLLTSELKEVRKNGKAVEDNESSDEGNIANNNNINNNINDNKVTDKPLTAKDLGKALLQQDGELERITDEADYATSKNGTGNGVENGVGNNGGNSDDEESRLRFPNRARKLSPTQIKLYSSIARFFSRFTPLYNKHVCSCCGQPKKLGSFYVVNSIALANRIDPKGDLHLHICKECTQKLFYYFYTQVTNKNVELAMQYLCTFLNIYWNLSYFKEAQQSFESNGRKGTLIGEYMRLINIKAPGKLFIDSDFIKEAYELDETSRIKEEKRQKEYLAQLAAQQKKARDNQCYGQLDEMSGYLAGYEDGYNNSDGHGAGYGNGYGAGYSGGYSNGYGMPNNGLYGDMYGNMPNNMYENPAVANSNATAANAVASNATPKQTSTSKRGRKSKNAPNNSDNSLDSVETSDYDTYNVNPLTGNPMDSITEEQRLTKKMMDTPYDWTQEDYNNKKLVMEMCGYDPFERESNEDKRVLYKDLLAILVDGMENDYIKLQAGINIVQSFFKIRKMTEKQTQMEQEDAPLAEQKALSDLKARELMAVSTYSKDNGMSERYASAKAKGELTLTGMMRAMDEKKYESNLVNKYDIQTSVCIEQAAEASMKAIFNQLSLSDSEVWKITQTQLEELKKLRIANAKLEEDLRRAKYEVAEMKLLAQSRLKSGN